MKFIVSDGFRSVTFFRRIDAEWYLNVARRNIDNYSKTFVIKEHL